jgi:hypothetical protein
MMKQCLDTKTGLRIVAIIGALHRQSDRLSANIRLLVGVIMAKERPL